MSSTRVKGRPRGGKAEAKADGIFARAYNSPIVYKSKKVAATVASTAAKVAGEASGVGKKLLQSTGRAAWVTGTTLLVLVLPLMILMDRENQIHELEQQQAEILGAPVVGPPQPPLLQPPM